MWGASMGSAEYGKCGMARRNEFRLHPSHRFALLAAGPSRSRVTGDHPFLNLPYIRIIIMWRTSFRVAYP